MLSELWSKLSRKRGNGNITPAERPEEPAPPGASPSVAAAEVETSAPGVVETSASGVTFPVDAVTPAVNPIWTETLAESLAGRFMRKVVVAPDLQQAVINTAVDALPEAMRGRSHHRGMASLCHPLIEAVHAAFSQHRPLTLSPDAIWLVIAQGFSHHVRENAEVLRARLVRHQGKQELTAKVYDLSSASFEQAIASFSSQIRDASDPVLYETLICDFSTTTPTIRTASEVAVMDSYSSYFAYEMRCVCGIPKITIEGAPEDWLRIRSRVEVIATYDLEWWISRLRPILDEFVLAAEGRPTDEFWQAIYKPVKAYGDQVATGWITDLFPYLGDAPDRRRNPVFEYARDCWALPVDKGVKTTTFVSSKGVRLRGFPSGLSSAPVKVSLPDGSSMDLDLVAGFLAVKQNPSDMALSPLIGWCVAEPPPKTPLII